MLKILITMSFVLVCSTRVWADDPDCNSDAAANDPRCTQGQQGQQGQDGQPGGDGSANANCANLSNFELACERIKSDMTKACDPAKMNKDIEKEGKAAQKEITGSDDDGGSGASDICKSMKQLNDKMTVSVDKFVKPCDDNVNYYNAQCAPDKISEQFNGCNLSAASRNTDAYVKAIENRDKLSAKLKASFKQSAAGADKCANQTSASESDKSGGDDKDKSASADEGGKKKSNGGGMGNGAMQALGMAASMLPALMNQNQDNTEQQPAAAMQPVELASTDCNLPANANSCTCKPNSPACLGSAGVPTNFNSQLPGVGGAAMARPDGSAPNLSLNDNPMANFHPPTDGAGGGGPGGGMGGYAGGGGGFGGGGHPNFTPDGPKGRAGSGLSADILSGVRGGSAGGAARNVGGGPAPLGGGGGGGGSHDPEDMKGYQLKAHPDFRQFLPPGAGSITASAGGSPTITRTLSGLDRIEGLHPSTVNMFTEMHGRYRMLWDSLYP